MVHLKYLGAKLAEFEPQIIKMCFFARAAHVRITRILPEFYYPPIPGRSVRVVSGDEYAQALFMDKMDRKFPIGLSLSGKEVVYGNLDFLDGRKGAHMNISGVSGIATKTTYSTFLLHSLLHCGHLTDAKNTHAIIFNVKGIKSLSMLKQNNVLSCRSFRFIK